MSVVLHTSIPRAAIHPTVRVDLMTRVELISHLTERVQMHEEGGAHHRSAIRKTAAETGLHPMIIRRLVDLYPEA